MALVITIIILLILAAISISMLIGDHGIIKRAQEAGRNYEEAAKQEAEMLNRLYGELENGSNGGNSDVSGGEDMSNATAREILLGYKAYSGGKLLTGTMPDRGAVSQTLNAGENYTIEEGYHNGSGNITAKDLASQTQATATASDIAQGKTAWVNGQKVTGTSSKGTSIAGSFFYSGNGSNYFQIDSIQGYQTVSLKGVYMYAMFFNEEGTQIEKVQGGTDYVSFSIPSETAFIRFNVPYNGPSGFTGYYIVQ